MTKAKKRKFLLFYFNQGQLSNRLRSSSMTDGVSDQAQAPPLMVHISKSLISPRPLLCSFTSFPFYPSRLPLLSPVCLHVSAYVPRTYLSPPRIEKIHLFIPSRHCHLLTFYFLPPSSLHLPLPNILFFCLCRITTLLPPLTLLLCAISHFRCVRCIVQKCLPACQGGRMKDSRTSVQASPIESS